MYDQFLLVRNPGLPELFCQSGNFFFYKSGHTIRSIEVQAKEFLNGLELKSDLNFKLGFGNKFYQVSKDSRFQEATHIWASK